MTLGSYWLERLLGRGGMGTVFLAYDTTLHRQVALKVLDGAADAETSRTRVLRDARPVPPPVPAIAMAALIISLIGVLYLGILPSRLINLAQVSILTIF